MRLQAHGIRADLPLGWEGGIRAEPAVRAAGDVRTSDHDAGTGTRPGHHPTTRPGPIPTTRPVAHFATFALPSARGDFGGDVVTLMDTSDAFVALLEYGPEEVGSALFAREGMPRRLDPRAFRRGGLHRTLAGQAGYQVFFTEAGRPFCLYVVLGDAEDAHRLVRRIEPLLAAIEIEPAT